LPIELAKIGLERWLNKPLSAEISWPYAISIFSSVTPTELILFLRCWSFAVSWLPERY